MLLKLLVKMLQFGMSSSIFWICFCTLVLHTCASSGADFTDDDEERTKNRPEDSISGSIYLFGTELMKGLEKGTTDNVFVSPLSAYLALSMIHLATEKDTRANLNEILKISDSRTDVSKLYENLGAVLQKITTKPDSDPYVANTLPEITLSNDLFVDDAFPIYPSYVQQLKTYYGRNASVINLNFGENVKATEDINSWISKTTKNRITNFFSQPLAKDTRAILTSAIYFKGAWEKPFQVTKTEKFKIDQRETDVQMMSTENYVPYYSNADLKFDSIELLYKGEEFAMMIVLPHLSQTVRNLTQYIHLLDFEQYKENQRVLGVEYKIPKMKILSKKSLIEALHLEETLRTLELRAMTSSYQDVTVQDVKQAAEIEVDENGTIATAVTVDEIATKMSTTFERDLQFIVDRPFLIFIVHKPTYAVLFSGIVYQPQTVTNHSNRACLVEGPHTYLLAAVFQLLIFYSKFLLN